MKYEYVYIENKNGQIIMRKNINIKSTKCMLMDVYFCIFLNIFKYTSEHTF